MADASQRNRAGAPPVDLERFLYLHLPPGMSVEQCLAKLAGHPWIESAEPDGLGEAGGVVVPTDPVYSQQWYHTNASNPAADIETPLAWGITTGSSNVIVAVLDTGVKGSLAEFSGRLLPGFDFVNNDADPTDDNGHGTAVAAVLAANANNGTGGAGVDWNCRILPVKVLDAKKLGYYSWWAQGIDYAVSRGAKVINLSAGGTLTDSNLTRAISNAIAQGVIFVTITHNDGAGTVRFPGSLPMSIAVGATDRQNRRCGFSNYGPQIDLVAPGTNIITLALSGGTSVSYGTSFAGPQVAGVCALLAALRPELTQEQARALLCAGAEDEVGDETDTPGFDTCHGWGRLNAYHSLLLATARVDTIHRLAGGGRVLSWSSPPNAAQRQPQRVATAASLDGPWTIIAETTGFGYTLDRTWWTNAPGGPMGFYRVCVWQP